MTQTEFSCCANPLALSEFFGLPPGINRTTGFIGVFPGDLSCLFDPETQRWFVVAWAQLNTPTGVPIQQSRLYLAVSETSDPTGDYFIYTLNTTRAHDPDQRRARVFPTSRTSRSITTGFTLASTNSTLTPTGTLMGLLMPPSSLSPKTT